MTVSYISEVATVSRLGAFLKLIFRWKGSIYKLLWFDYVVFLSIYYSIHLLYSCGLSNEGKHVFETIVKYFHKQSNIIPLSFLLGFYVSNVMSRWWDQYTSIPGVTEIAVLVTSLIQGEGTTERKMRRTIMRYACLSLTMVFRTLSPRVMKRFPDMFDLIEAGLINEKELLIIEDAEKQLPGYSKNWLPIVWAAGIVTKAKEEGMIKHDLSVKTLLDKLNEFRGSCGALMSYYTISVPLEYTQVVTIAVYSYFLMSLMGKQWIEGEDVFKVGFVNLDMIPIFLTLQFLFYMGWLKVAETLMNPFGEDDDDFEVNDMIDRNLQKSFQIVDKMRNQAPELTEDKFWIDTPKQLSEKTFVNTSNNYESSIQVTQFAVKKT